MSDKSHVKASLPKSAGLPINRCNLPAAIVGSLTYQQHPVALQLDSVAELYADIFNRLRKLENPVVRSRHFMAFMAAQFQLEHLEEMGFDAEARFDRSRATYLRQIRGWLFNPDSIEGAVLKGWAESRFGLIPRFHHTPIRHPADQSYRVYEQEWAQGLYNTNALETQLDLLYSYCQFELAQKFKHRTHITLYRGCNHISEFESFDANGNHAGTRRTILLNNINSFSDSRERADEFGDYVIQVEVPISKIVFYNQLLPGQLAGEDEYVVLGGLSEVTLLT
jgi:NAD+--dinitrogen-reductase ADP-D-ribosyltransferase